MTRAFGSGRALVLCTLAALAALHLDAGPPAEEWPQFRGPLRDGISQETGILHEWPAEGPKEVWRRPIGEGYSAVTIAGGRLFTMYAAPQAEEHLEFAAAFDPATGEEIWHAALDTRIETQFGNGPRSTPTVDGDAVFVLSGAGKLASLATADGSIKWELDVKEKFGGRRPSWGFATSAVIEGDLLILDAGGPDGKAFAGLDKATGEIRWTTGTPVYGPLYNSFLPVDLAGRRQLVYVSVGKVGAISPAGEELWTYERNPGEAHAMPVLVPPDRVFASGVEGVGSVLLKVHADGDTLAADEVWTSTAMKNHFSSSVALDGYIYGFDNATMKCISAADGTLAWARRGLGRGSLIVADGHLIVLSDTGTLLLLEADPTRYSEKGRVQALEGRSWTAPTLAGGKVYLRNHTEMVVYDLRG